MLAVYSVFQSARPVKGATVANKKRACVCRVSIRAPREGRDYHLYLYHHVLVVSIRAPREGRDTRG